MDQPDSETALSVSVEPEGLLVAGDADAVATYLRKLRFNAVELVEVAGVDAQTVTGAAALATGLAAIGAQHGTFVRIRPADIELLRKFKVIPGESGFNRMTVTDVAGRFRGQMQWQPVQLAGTKALSLQMAVATIALQTAIAETTAAIERVEGTVDQVLNLAKATTIGDVIGHHRSLTRIVRTLDETGTLPAVDWDSVAHLGPTIETVVERLRAHINKTINGFDRTKPVQDRAKYLTRAVRDNRLGETLELLALAQDSMYQWQRLRIERVRETEFANLELVIATARRILAEQLDSDSELLLKARAELASYAAIKPLELLRWLSTTQLKRDGVQLRCDLDSFATARRAEVLGWHDHEDPTVRDALAELGIRIKSFGDSAKVLGSRGLDAGATGLDILGRSAQRVAAHRRREAQPDTDDTESPWSK
ncbi:hypothetical protein ACFWUP_28555 [Nocardia sp. NPDC058658]|uniref:hypothetical protein n=1 Tax=Nocardia sp. NPDC058658 TaxID=3346580 RepID=UPI00364CEE2A